MSSSVLYQISIPYIKQFIHRGQRSLLPFTSHSLLHSYFCLSLLFSNFHCCFIISLCYLLLLLLNNRDLYWFTAVGSETVFYSNRCFNLPDWLLPRSNCYFLPKLADALCVPRSYCYFPSEPDLLLAVFQQLLKF